MTQTINYALDRDLAKGDEPITADSLQRTLYPDGGAKV
jgi:hypothetical protein